jgi:hypothetical protein
MKAWRYRHIHGNMIANPTPARRNTNWNPVYPGPSALTIDSAQILRALSASSQPADTPLRDGSVAFCKQVHHPPERANGQFFHLVVQDQRSVDMPPLADICGQNYSFQRGLARVVHRNQRRISIIPRLGEIEPTFLVPIRPVSIGNPVGRVQQRMIGARTLTSRVFIHGAPAQ